MGFVDAVVAGLEVVGVIIGYLTLFCFVVVLLWWWWIEANNLPGRTETTEEEEQKLIEDVRIARKEGRL